MVVTAETDVNEYIAKVHAFDELMSQDDLRERSEAALQRAVTSQLWRQPA